MVMGKLMEVPLYISSTSRLMTRKWLGFRMKSFCVLSLLVDYPSLGRGP